MNNSYRLNTRPTLAGICVVVTIAGMVLGFARYIAVERPMFEDHLVMCAFALFVGACGSIGYLIRGSLGARWGVIAAARMLGLFMASNILFLLLGA